MSNHPAPVPRLSRPIPKQAAYDLRNAIGRARDGVANGQIKQSMKTLQDDLAAISAPGMVMKFVRSEVRRAIENEPNTEALLWQLEETCWGFASTMTWWEYR